MRKLELISAGIACFVLAGCGDGGATDTEVRALRAELDQLRAEYDEREESLENFGKYVTANRERIVAVESQLASLRQEVDSGLQAESRPTGPVSLEDAIAALEARKAGLEQEVSAAEAMVSAAQKRYNELAMDVRLGTGNWAEDPRPSAMARLERLRDELQAARNRVQAVDDEIAYIRTYQRLP